MNKCEKCGFLHYRTDPCRVLKRSTAVRMDVQRVEVSGVKDGIATALSGSVAGTQVLPVDTTTPKPKRSGNRHRPGYFTEYMREYRAGKRRRSPPKPSIQTTTEERNDK